MKRRNLLKLGTLGALMPIIPNLGNATNCDPTTGDIEGPFYTPNAPVRNKISPEGAAGTVLFLTGTVYHNDCTTPISMASIDAWQASDAGAYDNVGFDYRGQFNADDLGNYSMETILPGKYLNGSSYRPRHIHFKFGAPGASLLTTQLYFEGDTDIPGDPWASADNAEGRIIPLTEDAEGNLHGVFDIYLDIDPVIDSTDDLDKGFGTRIINVFPNPVRETGMVEIFLANNAQVSMDIFSINGKKVRQVHQGKYPAGSHSLAINNLRDEGIKLNAGVYIVQLSINDHLTDAKRFMIV
ncbi:MAG: T9SS C-terminal target domain-containing protein [Bacteroidetes bacterium]|nr:MAG: T9SS C-terminal target domain-containing protein [Bacteroidota bacterium]